MSKRESLTRYNLIIKKLRKQASTFAEISDYLAFESDLQQYNFNVSKRTFQRDIEDIRSLYNIDIIYNHSKKVYYIGLDEQPEANERILEAFDIFNALNISDRLSNFIHFENRRSQGTENLYGLLHAIRNKLQISFSYYKFWEDEISQRIAEPYALKEFKNRWYLLVKDIKDDQMKSFALDRLRELEIRNIKFATPSGFNAEEYYRHCFGVIKPNDEEPQDVVLSFDPFQAKYIKSLPIHKSQEILNDNEAELLIRLNVYITHDFIMELLSFGDTVRVVQPEKLILEIKTSFMNAINQYN
jgi:predicted DNA-binding transcriptional regulator YafY